MFIPYLTQDTAFLISSGLKILHENCPSHSHSTPAPISSMPSHYSLLCAIEGAISIHFQSISLLAFLSIYTKCSLAFSKSISGIFFFFFAFIYLCKRIKGSNQTFLLTWGQAVSVAMSSVQSLVCQVSLTDCKYSHLAPRSDEKKVLASSVLQIQYLVCCLKLITADGKGFRQVCFLMGM